jgi:hypothetical protein
MSGFTLIGIWKRLAGQPAGMVTFNGKQYPWPDCGPTFFHDQAVSST